MRKRYITFLIGVFYAFIGQAQPVDLVLNSPESGTIVHQATNSITFSPGYAYTPAGGTMLAEIVNSGLIDTTTYITEIDPASRSLNTSDLVGTIDGSFNVNSVGAATYQIPIKVLPGASGLQPKLSLSYNSLGGPGVAGYGWSVSGISVVTRSPKSYYYDGEASGIDLSSNDRFSLDGQRLMCISGAYGGNGSLYRTENDNFTRVNGYTNTYGASKFLAETRNGLDYQYGYTSNASQTIDGHNEIVNWYVNSITDVYGNQINYTYIKDKGSVYISQITYGPNTISFSYKQRYDKSVQYFEGSKIEQNLILDKIEIKYNANVIRTYKLKYNYSGTINNNKYSLLNEVKESGIGGSQYNSMVFSYSLPDIMSFSYYADNTVQSIGKGSKLYFGDFNGDGKTDVFSIPEDPNTLGWKMYLGDGDGHFTLSDSGTTGDYKFISTADLNGDGLQDVILATYVEVYDNDGRRVYEKYEAWLSNGTSFSSSGVFASLLYMAGNEYLTPLDVIPSVKKVADFDGDGLSDFLLYTSNGAWQLYSYSNGSGTLTSSITKQGYGSIANGLSYSGYFGDFDGDGITDLFSVASDGLRIFSYHNGSFNQIYSTPLLNSTDFYRFGDFNGDGKTDVFKYGDSSGDLASWSMMLSTGSGFDTKSIPQKKSNLKDDNVYVGDFNGDGATDLMVYAGSNDPFIGSYSFISKEQGTDFYTSRDALSQEPISVNTFYFEDFTGDGRTDYLCTAGADSWTGYKLYASVGLSNILMDKVANGLNQLTKISYKKLSDSDAPYTKGTGAEFPVYDFQGALSTVTSIVTDNGVGSKDTVNYSYEGAKIHRQGKGFLCFSQIKATDSATGISTERNSAYDLNYFFPTLLSIYHKLGEQNLNRITNVWDYKATATGVIFPYIRSTNKSDYLTTHSESKSFIYDNYGNPTKVVTSYYNGVTITTDNIYDNNATNWWLGMLTNSTTSYEKTGETTITRTVGYSYFTDGILKPDWVNYYSGTSQHRSVNNDYDSHGNLIQAVEATDDGGLKQTNYTYDDDGIHTKNTTDPLGHTTTYNYDTYGRLSSEVDYLNNTTSYTYDGFGRTATQTKPDGFVITKSYNWGLSGGPANACYFIQQSGNDGSEAKVWYDKLNREIRKDVKGFDGSNIYTVTEYNEKGQVYRTSEPSVSATPSQWNTNAYDDYGRITAVNRPSGRNTSYSYDVNKVEVTTGGKARWKETDSEGLVIQAHDDGGDIVYAYYPDGKVKTVTTSDGAVTSMEYDVAGNQKKLVDPSAGTINYTYNGFGDLKTQSNAESQTATYNYYPQGLLLTKVTPEGTTTYTYNDNKQLTGITSPDNVSRTYGYDGKGRVNTITETIPGTTALTTSFTYDNLGRLSTRTHPSGIVETHTYNSSGYLASVAAGGATRYTIMGMNARQQITTATYGSGLNATFDFDTYGYPQASKAQANSVYVQDYGYSFDPVTGNLNSRDNNVRSLHESFSYDNLDRLTGVSGPSNLTMDYNLNGNINTKSDVGTDPFVYNIQGKPYALSEVTSSSGIIPTDSLTATYTSFEQVSTLDQGNYHAAFTYNSDDQRCKMEISDTGSAVLTRWYAGGQYMKESDGTSTKQYTWIGGDAYTAPAVAVTDGGTTTWYYLMRDYLGNVTQVVDGTNAVTAEYNYDPWGRRRDKDTWSYTLDNEPTLFAGRGFTGHEHLPWFNVINMNGRLFDPLVGRFLSPDENIQMPDFTQNFNRYSYGLNNPFKYRDTNGEWLWIPLMIIGAYIGGTSANHGELNPAQWNWNTDTWLAVIFGGAMGAAGGYWIMHPEAFTLNIGIASPYAQIGVVAVGAGSSSGAGTDWSFNFYWSTAAGGGGNVNLNGTNTSPEEKVNTAIAEAKENVRYTIESYNIEMRRIAESPNATLSEFTAYGPVPLRPVSGYFLEPGGPSTTTSGLDKRIPAGIYNVVPYSSADHPDAYQIFNELVSPNRYILIHPGNYHYDTLGCLLPGCSYTKVKGDYAVWRSGDKLDELRNLLGHHSTNLFIYDINKKRYKYGW